ncbi:CPBP family glutamic-type intramembrane protease [Heyndrickxia sporothermodurans]
MGIIFGKGIRYVFPSLATISPNLLEFAIMVFLAQVCINFLPSLGVAVKYKQSIKEIYKLNRISLKQLGWSILLFILVQGILLFLHYIIEKASILIGNSYQMSFYPTADNWQSLIVLIVFIGIIPPICEDLFFRGFLFSGSSEYGGKFAVFFTAFAFFQDNPFRFGEIFVYAVFVGYIVLYTNSTYPGMILHVLTNTSYVIGSYFMAGDFVAGVSSSNKDGNAMLQFIIYTVIGAISLILSLKVVKKLKDLSTSPIGEKESKGAVLKWLNIPIVIVTVVFIFRVLIGV